MYYYIALKGIKKAIDSIVVFLLARRNSLYLTIEDGKIKTIEKVTARSQSEVKVAEGVAQRASDLAQRAAEEALVVSIQSKQKLQANITKINNKL